MNEYLLALLGGALIGLSVSLMLLWNGRVTGISGIFYGAAIKLDELVFADVKKFRGSISAEHGVGLTKKLFLTYTRSPAEIEIMNPGKIF